jgi:hypothetical protein
MPESRELLLGAARILSTELADNRNVIGVGSGPKIAGGRSFKEDPAVRIFVNRKLPDSEVKEPLPRTVVVDGRAFMTDVIEVGQFRALSLPIGVQAGPTGSGRWGRVCIYLKDGQGEIYALTCAHVLQYLDVGAMIHGGGESRTGTVVWRKSFENGGNTVDAALIRLTRPSSLPVSNTYLSNINLNNPPISMISAVDPNEKVDRIANNVSSGTREGDLAEVKILIPDLGTFGFVDQYQLVSTDEDFAVPGLSGSLIKDNQGGAAMLIAAATQLVEMDSRQNRFCIATPLQSILDVVRKSFNRALTLL